MTDVPSTDELELLITDYLSGNCTPSEQDALLSILASDPVAAQLFQRFSAIRAVASVPAFEELQESNLLALKQRMQFVAPINKRKPISVWMKVAAAVLLLIASNALWYLYTDNLTEAYTDQQAFYEIRVPAGSRTNIVLPDGTDVTLNAGSVLRYCRGFGIRDRRVTLQGEGYFKVTKNREIPFYVNTDGVQVQVVGTIFNVSAYADESYITVDLIEGRVNLDGSGHLLQLFPNEHAVYNRQTGKMSKTIADVSGATEWMKKILVFDNESFAVIARKLEREFRVKIVIESERLKREHFSGSFDGRRAITDILDEIDVEKRYNRKIVGDTIYIINK